MAERTGRRSVNVLPLPGTERAESSPPSRRASSRAMGRP